MRCFFHRRVLAGNDAKSEKKVVKRFFYVKTITLTIFIFIVLSYPPTPQNTNFVRILFLVSTIKGSIINAVLFLSNCSGFNNSLLVNSQCISN